MPATCQLQDNSYYVLQVIKDEGNETTQSSPVLASNSSSLEIADLAGIYSYRFTILSNNSIGQGSSASIAFCKYYTWVEFKGVAEFWGYHL